MRSFLARRHAVASVTVSHRLQIRSVRHRRVEGSFSSVGPSRTVLTLHPAQQLVTDFADDLTPFQTMHELWALAIAGSMPMTFMNAWPRLFDAITNAERDGDTSAHKRLTTYDLWALARASNRSELQALLQCLPDKIRIAVLNDPDFNVDTLEEVFVHLGQRIEIRAETLVKRLDIQPTVDDMRYILSKTGKFADDGRGCIAGTLHRVSCWMSRTGTVLGVTMRVGRYLPGVAAPFLDRARSGNLLFLSKPGQGKTTMLRDLAVSLARRSDSPRVVVIDSANEIGGDSDAPLPCMGRVRRLQVPKRSMQLNYMTQAVQNHSPDYVIIDEIATTEEADAALTMSQRGVRLIATAHGETLGKLVQNKALNYLVGGVAQAFLSNEERKLKLKIKKTVLERPYDAPFTTVVELRSRKHAMMHVRVNESVDMLLDDRDPWQDRKCCKVIRYENGPGQSSGLPLPRALVESSEDDDTPTTSSTERITRDLRKGDEDAMDDFDLDDAPSSSTRFRAVKAAKVDDDGYSLSDRT